MEQRVRVIAIEGDEAIVSGRRSTTCSGCAGKASCSTLGSWADRFVEMRVKNSIHAEVGDEVLLEVPDKVLLRVAFRLYGLPILIFIAAGLTVRGFALQAGWAMPEIWAAAAGLVGILATYGWMLISQPNAAAKGLGAKAVRVTQRAGSIPISIG